MTNKTSDTGDNDTLRVMVDIETLGLEIGSAIISIGCVTFTKEGINDEFYEEISLASCQEAGLEIDAETLEWWLDQDSEVKDVLTGGRPLEDVLKSFCNWYPDGDTEIWAKPPSFDCVQLDAAFKAVGLSKPWGYRDKKDVRTLQSLPFAADVEMSGDKHDALDDAKYQARQVSKTLQRLPIRNSQEKELTETQDNTEWWVIEALTKRGGIIDRQRLKAKSYSDAYYKASEWSLFRVRLRHENGGNEWEELLAPSKIQARKNAFERNNKYVDVLNIEESDMDFDINASTEEQYLESETQHNEP